MRYVDFREVTLKALRRKRTGMTWAELREQLDLPYERPCPEWVRRMESESGLERVKGPGRSLVWKVR